MPLTIEIEKTKYRVERYQHTYQLGSPSRASLTVRHKDASPASVVADWLGRKASISWTGESPDWSEDLVVTGVESQRTVSRIICNGPTIGLCQRRGRRAWTGKDPAAVVQELFADVKVSSTSRVDRKAKLEILFQCDHTDHDFAWEVARSFGFSIVERSDGSVVLCDEPSEGNLALDLEDVLTEFCRSLGEVGAGGVQASVLPDGKPIELIRRDADEGNLVNAPTFQPLPRSEDQSVLSAIVDARTMGRRRAVVSELTLRRGDAFVGQIVEAGEAWDGGAIVGVARELRDGAIETKIRVVPEGNFRPLRSTNVPSPMSATAFSLATVTSTGHGSRPGWVSVRLPWQAEGQSVEAQLTTGGGGLGHGSFWLPALGAEVLLALEGDPISPRLLVLGVLAHKKHPLPLDIEADPPDVVLASSRGGASITIIEKPGEEAILLTYPGTDVTVAIGKSGTLSVKGSVLSLKTDTFSLEANQVTISGKEITLKGRDVRVQDS